MTTVNQLINDLKKWHDGDAAILYQYITSEHGAMNEAEFVHVAEWLDRNDQFGDAMSELMNEWINEARQVLANVSPCCNAPLFSEVCEGCKNVFDAVPVCEVCGQVDERQELRRCVKHERICFGCDYLTITPHETMMDDGAIVLICDECHNRTTGGNE
jgi:hypothetical protein